jgi:hypothetical protein
LVELRVQLPLQVDYSYEGEIKRAKEQLKPISADASEGRKLFLANHQSSKVYSRNVLTSNDRHQRYEEIIFAFKQKEHVWSKLGSRATAKAQLDADRFARTPEERFEQLGLKPSPLSQSF